MKDLHVRAITIKLLSENTEINLHDLEFGKYSYFKCTKLISNKEKIDTVDFIKIKILCPSKDTIKKVKRQSKEMGNNLQVIYLIMNLYLEYVKEAK